MKSYEIYTGGYRAADGTIVETKSVELYESPLWREIVGQVLYWIDLRKPRWFEPGNGRPSHRDNADGTCTFLWRLNLELWLGYEFQHKRRRVIRRVDLS